MCVNFAVIWKENARISKSTEYRQKNLNDIMLPYIITL